MNLERLIVSSLIALSAVAIGPAASFAQQAQDSAAEQNPSAEQAPAAEKEAENDTLSVTVRVVQATGEDRPLANKPIILRASRPIGPFEQRDPEPAEEWTALSDASGEAHFDAIDASIAEQGLRLHAVTTHGGEGFKSAQVVPRDGAELSVPVYETGHDASGVTIANLQTAVHVWEDHLFFQQMWMLTVEGDRIVDTTLLEGEEFEDGLPLRLPIKAKGINVRAAQQTEVIDSTVYWRGKIKPGEMVAVTVQYSMSANATSFVYEQELDYPAKDIAIVVPLEPQHERLQIPYFEGLALAAPGFEVEQGRGAQGSQNNGLHLTAERSGLRAGDAFKFKLSGLPYEQPTGAWIALGLGILGALFVFGFARGERRRVAESHRSGELVEILEQEREDLLDELALLEEDWADGEVSELEYERERLLLRERTALVMKKLRDLEEDQAA